MRKILATLVALGVALAPTVGVFPSASVAYAEDSNPITTSGSGGGESISSFTGGGSGDDALSGISSGDQKQSEVENTQCPSNSENQGGGMGNSIFGSIIRAAGGDENIANLLGGLASGDGNIDSGAIVNAVLGNSEIGEQLGNYGISGSDIAGILQGQSGGVDFGSIGSSIFGGGSGSGGGFGDIAGGLLGDSGSLLGGIGGGTVPVSDSKVQGTVNKISQTANKISETAKSIEGIETVVKDNVTELRIKECVTDLMVAKQARELTKESTAKTIETITQGPTRPVENYAELRADARQSGKENYIDRYEGPFREEVRTYLEQTLRAESGSTPNVDCGESGNINLFFFKSSLRPAECTRIGAKNVALSELQKAGDTAENAVIDAVTNPTGVRPQVTPCERGDTVEDCPDAKIETSAKSISTALESAISAGEDLNRNADEPGELDVALGSLFERILTSFGGLREGLTRRDRGGTTNSSFLEQLTSEAENISLPGGQGTVLGDITESVSLEAIFQDFTKKSIDALDQNIAVFKEIGVCYAALTSQPAGVTTPVADAARNAVATAGALQVQADALRQSLENSRNTVSELSVLLSRAENRTLASSDQTIKEDYASLQLEGKLHTSAQMQALALETDARLNALAFSLADANLQLEQCKAY